MTRQPYADLTRRGIKKIEYRSRPTKIIGERFYIYAARKWAAINGETLTGVEPGHLLENDVVDVDDLLLVINNWTTSPPPPKNAEWPNAHCPFRITA